MKVTLKLALPEVRGSDTTERAVLDPVEEALGDLIPNK